MSTPVSSTETNLALAREYLERVFNAHRPELAAEYFTPDVKWHGGTLGTVEGPENVVALLQGFMGGLPDLNAVEEDALAQGDLVAMRFVINATHGGPLFGVPATGNRVRWTAVDIYRMENGKIAEEWAADDLTAILHDMGVYFAAVVLMSAATRGLGALMERNVSEVFGERDPDRRRRAIAECYQEECAIYDADGESIGQAAVSDRVGRILDKSPPGFAFSLLGPAEVIHDLGRLRWQNGPAGAPPVLSGMDVAVFANGRIRTLYTFIETPGAAEA